MGSDQVRETLLLNEFKVLYREVGRFLPSWARFLLLGWLVKVEQWVIKNKIKVAVDEAIEEYETFHPPIVSLPPPVYSETGKGFFDEMRLTAPWKTQEDPSDPP